MGLLFGLENGKNTTYSHIKIGKMVHKDKKNRAASGDTLINGTPRGSRSRFMGLRSKVRLHYTGISLSAFGSEIKLYCLMGRECKPREVNNSSPQAPSNLHEFFGGLH